jgi:serine/threonine protein kinase
LKYCDSCHTTYPNEFSTCPKDQGELRVTAELVEGMILRDKYLILEKVGAGGMASVYRARHLAFAEIRAIKVVASRFSDDEDLLKRFRTEAIITRKLQHPHAVRVDDLDATEDGRPFIVMEYVEGLSLRQVLSRAGSLSPLRAVRIARQVASALGAAHRLGIVHRDIKPDNILLLEKDGEPDFVKVLDFGIAKIREGTLEVSAAHAPTQTGIVVGTPQYLSPEQAMGKRGGEIDGRADLYALGLVLYEMLVGRLPFEADSGVGMLLHHVQTAPRPPHHLRPDLALPGPLSGLLMKVLDKDRNQRFATAEDMVAALTAVEPLVARPAATLVEAEQAVSGPEQPTLSAAVTAPRRVATPRQQQLLPQPEPPRSGARAIPWLLGFVLLAILGGGLFAGRHRGALAPTSDDARILAALRRALATELLRDAVIEPSVADGVVTLAGRAPRQSEADIAVSLASGVPGVHQVVNQIEVGQAVEISTTAVSPPVTPVQMTVPPLPPPERPALQLPAPPESLGAETPTRVVSLLETARRALERGDVDAAEQALRSVLEIDPANAFAQSLLSKLGAARGLAEGERAMTRGDYAAAAAAFRAVLDADPANELARIALKQAEDALTSSNDARARPRR